MCYRHEITFAFQKALLGQVAIQKQFENNAA